MIVAFFIHLPSLSSPLLLRISPKTFAFIPILHMCLSSLNRSIYAVSRHILPCVAPLCKALHYSKTGVPWQMNSTFILFSINYLFLSNYLKPLILLDLLDFYFFINLPSAMIISLLPISLQYLTL